MVQKCSDKTQNVKQKLFNRALFALTSLGFSLFSLIFIGLYHYMRRILPMIANLIITMQVTLNWLLTGNFPTGKGWLTCPTVASTAARIFLPSCKWIWFRLRRWEKLAWACVKRKCQRGSCFLALPDRSVHMDNYDNLPVQNGPQSFFSDCRIGHSLSDHWEKRFVWVCLPRFV